MSTDNGTAAGSDNGGTDAGDSNAGDDDRTAAPYGTWPSPLTAAQLAAGGIRLDGAAQRDNEIWWAELRPAEGGRSVLVRRVDGGEPEDMIAEPWSARTRVHEYGGGAWWLGASSAYFANWTDQRLFRLDPTPGTGTGTDTDTGAEPVPLTPEPPSPAAWRYADGREHPSEPWVVCVRERHGDADEAINELVAISTEPGVEGPSDPTVLLIGEEQADPTDPGPDFVAAPRFSPDGRWLSWIRWDHPRMPWDGTELCVAPVFAGIRLGNVQVVAGNDSEAVHGADWTADGRLVYSTDRSGFWNLHAWTPGSSDDTALTELVGSEIGGPQWVFGTQRWTELSDGRIVAAVTTAATDSLVVLGPDGSSTPLPSTPLTTSFVAIADLVATDHDTVLVRGSTALALPSLVELDLDGEVVTEHRPADEIGVGAEWFSVAQSVTYRSGNRKAQAFIYLPSAPGHRGPDDELPPLVVMGHGGPTSHSSPALNLRVQYWTSRGFAVADVNYGGSSGFGRAYRRLLDDAWGLVDVEDCVSVAVRLADESVVDPRRMAIRGGSAGGFTVLSALVQSSVFAAGTSLYGVADLEALARETHKFESRYLDGLIGRYPEDKAIYEERSPINHTDSLSCPLLVLQGLEDEVVPPNQSEAIVAALAAKDIPHAYVAFEGEQHGFRQEANIIRSYEVELWFYGRVFGFDPADEIEAPSGAIGL